MKYRFYENIGNVHTSCGCVKKNGNSTRRSMFLSFSISMRCLAVFCNFNLSSFMLRSLTTVFFRNRMSSRACSSLDSISISMFSNVLQISSKPQICGRRGFIDWLWYLIALSKYPPDVLTNKSWRKNENYCNENTAYIFDRVYYVEFSQQLEVETSTLSRLPPFLFDFYSDYLRKWRLQTWLQRWLVFYDFCQLVLRSCVAHSIGFHCFDQKETARSTENITFLLLDEFVPNISEIICYLVCYAGRFVLNNVIMHLNVEWAAVFVVQDDEAELFWCNSSTQIIGQKNAHFQIAIDVEFSLN